MNIPEQAIEDGFVRLLVVEGHLYSITVTGNEHYSWSNSRTKLPSLTPGALIYEPTFVKELVGSSIHIYGPNRVFISASANSMAPRGV